MKTQLEAFVKACNDLDTTLRSVSSMVCLRVGRAPRLVAGREWPLPLFITIQTEMHCHVQQSVPVHQRLFKHGGHWRDLAKMANSLDSTKLSGLTNNPDGVRQLAMGRAQFFRNQRFAAIEF